MGRGLGIAALIVVILGIFVPIYGIFITGIGLAMATVAALAGDRACSTASTVLAGVSTFFLSPLLWIVLYQNQFFYMPVLAFLIAPFVGMIIDGARSKNRSHRGQVDRSVHKVAAAGARWEVPPNDRGVFAAGDKRASSVIRSSIDTIGAFISQFAGYHKLKDGLHAKSADHTATAHPHRSASFEGEKQSASQRTPEGSKAASKTVTISERQKRQLWIAATVGCYLVLGSVVVLFVPELRTLATDRWEELRLASISGIDIVKRHYIVLWKLAAVGIVGGLFAIIARKQAVALPGIALCAVFIVYLVLHADQWSGTRAEDPDAVGVRPAIVDSVARDPGEDQLTVPEPTYTIEYKLQSGHVYSVYLVKSGAYMYLRDTTGNLIVYTEPGFMGEQRANCNIDHTGLHLYRNQKVYLSTCGGREAVITITSAAVGY